MRSSSRSSAAQIPWATARWDGVPAPQSPITTKRRDVGGGDGDGCTDDDGDGVGPVAEPPDVHETRATRAAARTRRERIRTRMLPSPLFDPLYQRRKPCGQVGWHARRHQIAVDDD